jgi:hypothetical protein
VIQFIVSEIESKAIPISINFLTNTCKVISFHLQKPLGDEIATIDKLYSHPNYFTIIYCNEIVYSSRFI